MKNFLCVGLIAVFLSGCGELSYKRGASARDLEVAKESCQSAGTGKAVEKCLEDKGWVVHQLDDVDLFATAGVTSDNRNLSSAATPAAWPTAVDAGGKRAERSPSTAPLAGHATVGSEVSQARPSAPASPANPLDVYTISSWWKLGAGRDVLEAQTNECVNQLGEAHRPNNKTQQVTRGFVVCMYEKGWKGLRTTS